MIYMLWYASGKGVTQDAGHVTPPRDTPPVEHCRTMLAAESMGKNIPRAAWKQTRQCRHVLEKNAVLLSERVV